MMIKKLRFNDPDKSKFFCSDLHVFHNPNWENPLWKMRGYNSVEEMNRDIIDKINAKVGADDVLFHLGDLALNSTAEKTKSFLSQIVCQNIYHLFGNHHGSDYSIYKEEVYNQYGLTDKEVYPLRYKNLVFLGRSAEVVVDHQLIYLSHYPMFSWNKSHKELDKGGSISLSGHEHYHVFEHTAANKKGKRALDVGWEGKNDIYSFEEIMKIMKEKKVTQNGHHKSNTD